jgi:hypothetical protein
VEQWEWHPRLQGGAQSPHSKLQCYLATTIAEEVLEVKKKEGLSAHTRCRFAKVAHHPNRYLCGLTRVQPRPIETLDRWYVSESRS